MLLVDPRQWACVPLYYLNLAMPFYLSGLAIALLLSRGGGAVSRLYAVDLAGRARPRPAWNAPRNAIPPRLQLAAADGSRTAAWCWGINGFATVLGSVAAMLCGMIFGFQRLLLTAGGCYVAAWLALPRSDAGPATPSLPKARAPDGRSA